MQISLRRDCNGQVEVKVGETNHFPTELYYSHSFAFEEIKDRGITVEVFSNKEKPVTRLLRNYGKKLFNVLFKKDTPAWRLLQGIPPLDAKDSVLPKLNDHQHLDDPVLLELNSYRDLEEIPWEYAWSGDGYLVCQRIFTRILKGEERQLPNLPLRVVVVAPQLMDSHDLNLTDLHLNDQFQNFIDEYYKISRKVTLERVLPATVNKLNSILADKHDETATALHFMGHCASTDNGSRALVFEHREYSKSDMVKMPRLINSPANLRLAFLSACNTREIAWDMVQRGVCYAIGSHCSLPDDIARKFETQFYHQLTQGQSVDRSMWRTRLDLADDNNFRQRDYLPGAMVLYSCVSQADDNNGLFLCDRGEPIVNFNMPPNNLGDITTTNFCGREKEFGDLYEIVKRMATRGRKVQRVCTITGIGGQGKTMLAVEVAKRTAHFFPGGVFAFQFGDDKAISAKDYLWKLNEVLFSKDAKGALGLRNGAVNVEELEQRIFKQFKASCLLILDHADSLKRAEDQHKEGAVRLVAWLKNVISRSDIAVKILATSYENLGWPEEESLSLKGFNIDSGYELFVQNLSTAVREKMQQEANDNTEQLLRELVKRMDGHPLSLVILGRVAGLPEYLNKSLKEIVYNHYCTMLADDNRRTKSLENCFKPMIDALSEQHRLLLNKCSLCTGPIDEDSIRMVDVHSGHEVPNGLQQLYNRGLLLMEDNEYKNHFAVKEAVKQLIATTNLGTNIADEPSESRETEVEEFKIKINSDSMVFERPKILEKWNFFGRRPVESDQFFRIQFVVKMKKTLDGVVKHRGYHKISIHFIQVSGSDHLRQDCGYYIDRLKVTIKPDTTKVTRVDFSPPQILSEDKSKNWNIKRGLVPPEGIFWEYHHNEPSLDKVYTLDNLLPHSVTYQWQEPEPSKYIIDIAEFLGFSKSPTNDNLVNRATIELKIGQHYPTSVPLSFEKCLWYFNGRNVPRDYKKSVALECKCCQLTAHLWSHDLDKEWDRSKRGRV